ncbi:MAG TPA: hypothetical protein VMR25_22180 [Planctomycetaceae bacterium]|jgi:uncharacterized protein YdcH (DUF465 family)|nr:hypothetical protein [Planctomycetaceae bacterium]
MRRACVSAISACLTAGLVLTACRADDSSTKTPPSKPAATAANPKSVKPSPVKPVPAALTAEREADALAFAREHHPELAALIEKLRKDNRRQFDRAIRELAQDHERLVRLKKVSPPQYDLALAAWKLDSRAHLLAARMTMSQNPALEAELKQVLRDRVDVRLKQLQFERGRLQDRLTTVDKAIQGIEGNKEAVADRDLQRIKHSVARSRRPATKKPTPSETKSSSAASPVVAERPRAPVSKTAASVAPPSSESANTATKTKQD